MKLCVSAYFRTQLVPSKPRLPKVWKMPYAVPEDFLDFPVPGGWETVSIPAPIPELTFYA